MTTLKGESTHCTLCSLGCVLGFETTGGGSVQASYPGETSELRHGICGRGHLNYELAGHALRLEQPLVRTGKGLEPTRLDEVVDGLAEKLASESTLVLVNGSLPVEDIALSEIGELYQAYEDPPPVNAELRLWAPANSGVWQGFYLANGYCGMPPDEPLDRDGPVTRSLRLASVGMLWSPDGWKDLPHALNRFRLVGRVVHDTPENRGVDVAVAARLSDPAAALPALTPGAGSLRLTRETPIRVDLQVETDSRQMLVCSDRFDPDWVATLDGNPAAILPLYNAALRGIVIPPGLHRVVMVYRSRSFRTGAVISGATALMLVLVGLWQLLRRRDGC